MYYLFYKLRDSKNEISLRNKLGLQDVERKRIKDVFYKKENKEHKEIRRRYFFDGDKNCIENNKSTKEKKLTVLNETLEYNSYTEVRIYNDTQISGINGIEEYTRVTFLRSSGYREEYGKFYMDQTDFGIFLTFKIGDSNQLGNIQELMNTFGGEFIGKPKERYIKEMIDYWHSPKWLLDRLPCSPEKYSEAIVCKEWIRVDNKMYIRCEEYLPFWNRVVPYERVLFYKEEFYKAKGTYDAYAIVMLFNNNEEIRGCFASFSEGLLERDSLEDFTWNKDRDNKNDNRISDERTKKCNLNTID